MFTKAITRMVRFMGRESFRGQMVVFMKAISRMVSGMGRESIRLLVVMCMKAVGRLVRRMGRESFRMLTVMFTKVIGKMVTLREKRLPHIPPPGPPKTLSAAALDIDGYAPTLISSYRVPASATT